MIKEKQKNRIKPGKSRKAVYERIKNDDNTETLRKVKPERKPVFSFSDKKPERKAPVNTPAEKKPEKSRGNSVLDFVFDCNYAVGCAIVDKTKSLWEYTVSTAKQMITATFKKSEIITQHAGDEVVREIVREAKATIKPMVSAKNAIHNILVSSRSEFKKGPITGIKYLIHATVDAFRAGRRFWKSLYNILAPVGALVVLVLALLVITNIDVGLSVAIDGEHVGYIENEAIYKSAEKLLEERVIYQSAEDALQYDTSFKLGVVKKSEKLDAASLADKMLLTSADAITEGYGVYVDDVFKGAITEKDKVEKTLRAKLDAAKTGYKGEVVSFVQNIQFVEGYYLKNTVKTQDNIIEYLNGDVAGSVYYTAQKGDTLYAIAGSHGISLAELNAMNPEINGKIYVGTQLLVSANVPVLNIKIVRSENYDMDVPYGTTVQQSNKYYTGYSIVSKRGVNGKNNVTADVTYVDGKEVSRNIVKTVVLSEPQDQIVVRGTKSVIGTYSTQTGNGAYIWPVGGNGGYVSCYFGGYKGHMGQDIACNVGTPVYAVASGVVVQAGYQASGLGRFIAIDHGNGVITYYGHLSTSYVSKGQSVGQGQVIGLSGNTGRSSGPHLHIGFKLGGINGYFVNPVNYIGSRSR